MSLQTEYTASQDSIFRGMVQAGLVHQAVTTLGAFAAIGSPTPTDIRNVRLARRVFTDANLAAVYMAAGLASAGLSAVTADSTLQTAINNNFPTLNWLFDPTYSG